MKKHLLIFIIFFLALLIAKAEDIYFNILHTQSVTEIQSGLQTAIVNATSSDRVIVTGSKTDANATLTIYIPDEKTVVWQAIYRSNSAIERNSLIAFLGSGTFEVNDGELMSETSEEIITSTEEYAIVKVSGGKITAKEGNAIVALGRNANVFVTGGYVSNDAVLPFPTIVVYNIFSSNQALVHISGNGKVEAKGAGSAIIALGSVKVSGNAQVSNNTGGDNTAAIRGSSIVEVCDNAIVRASNNYAIYCEKNVFVSGNSIVEAKENAIAIYIHENDGNVEIKDQAQVIAAHNYAIYTNYDVSFSLFFTGGMTFAYGNKISDVIKYSLFSGITNSGVVLAWNKEAGNSNYKILDTEDIFIYPESAVAYWDKKGVQFGISYANGSNAGFVPLDVVVLDVKESALPNIKIFPNPTTGQLTISSEQLSINQVEVFDSYGKLLTNCNLRPISKIDISDFSSGTYILKIATEQGEIAKKIIKQ